ncbi:MAG: immune inhibitor A domain-containing protein [Gemmatimonadaceae bacterium]
MRHAKIAGAAFLSLASVLATPVAAQDIEARAAAMGRDLPPSYYTRIALDPTIYELSAGWRNRLASAATQESAVAGVLNIAVIPTLFASSSPAPAVVSLTALQTQLFDGPASSTLSGFYTEISLGQLEMRGTVAPWSPTSLTIAEVTGSSMGLGAGARIGPWLRESVAAADAHIDFRQFDNDGPDGRPNSGDDDGRVDAAAFLFHEVDASCGGSGPWPHRSRISGWGGGPAATNDIGAKGNPIVVNDYILLGASDCTGTKALGSNVFAHEMGHVLGLPDYYDASGGLARDQRRWVIGCWDLMSGGAWGCGSGPQPASMLPPHMGPLPKAQLKWITATLVPTNTRTKEFVLRPVRTSGDVLRVDLSATEYLLIEYRDRSGFDADLPAAGVLVYRVVSGRAFLPCATCPRTYSYNLLEADGNAGLTRPEIAGGNRGEAGDLFLTGSSITRTSNPSTALNDGSLSSVEINSIVIDQIAKVARVTVSTALSAPMATLTSARIIAALADGGVSLTAEERAQLDEQGNRNGRFDIGDARAYLRRNP